MENYESFEEQAKRKEERIREYNALKAASAECRYGEQDCNPNGNYRIANISYSHEIY